MTLATGVLIVLVLTWAASAAYVYHLRGATRYTGPQQYLRKNWPLFAPLNCLLYACTRRGARTPVVAPEALDADLRQGLALLRGNWTVIRDEALALHARGRLEAPVRGAPASFDVGFRTFYKRGWSRFYLHWYGYTHPSARAECPRTLELLARTPGVQAAMFSILPPGGQLTLHADPMACSLRWHLGLATPGDDACFIAIDGERRSWRDGEEFVFDQTFLHHARNDTAEPRLILMADVRRPMAWPGRWLNVPYRWLSRLLLAPNDARDGRGAASAVFAAVAPAIAAGRRLHARAPVAYAVVKWTVNALLVAGVLAAAWWGLRFVTG
ncbi:aspartyl/asparaginyl beta-hydroxylase domain-containing protein [Arenimonas composti]|uniref:Aspartyl/asparaginy/proline hydroxylase domain-containing protein n=1 Tax=Arenimonas composti TR7-09 = DSM 18010 TaxID=1121013 RepID=A0A091BFN8_9GAMM|nr:aspartyl/asparaginyl beta-hydroxylase domain-containing protein [Arenimonas composti]KFN50546.1 hypothetical protein P873_06255 [Arenimonas composti TR7-09 = DSM 18010]